jgi:hypothetical protein
MRFFLIVTGIIIWAQAFGQNHRAGLYFSPDIAYRRETGNFITLSTTEIAKWGFTTGLTYEREIKKRFWLNTGIYFTDKGYQTKQLFMSDLNGNVIGLIRLRYSFYQVGIPVNAQYYISNRKLRFFVFGGPTVSYLVKARVKTLQQFQNGREATERSTIPRNNLELFYITANIGYGIEKDFGTITARLFVNLNYSFTDIYRSNAFFNSHLYSTGLGLGVYKRL